MKLLLDMNVSPKLAVFLRDAGFDAVHWNTIGPAEAGDVEILAYAAAVSAVVVTHDLDFGALLHRSGHSAPSVIQIRADDLSVQQLGGKLAWAVSELGEELATGALVTLDVERTRVRLLPIQRQ